MMHHHHWDNEPVQRCQYLVRASVPSSIPVQANTSPQDLEEEKRSESSWMVVCEGHFLPESGLYRQDESGKGLLFAKKTVDCE